MCGINRLMLLKTPEAPAPLPVSKEPHVDFLDAVLGSDWPVSHITLPSKLREPLSYPSFPV